MATEKRFARPLPVFPSYPEAWRDPRNRLFAGLLADLPPIEQITRMTETLRSNWNTDEEWGKNALLFLRGFKDLFGTDECSYRKHLRDLYYEVREKALGYSPESVPACTFELGIVGEVLQGWQPGSQDLHECFRFVCQAYGGLFSDLSEGELNRKLRQGILDLLRRHMEKLVWESQDLDSWILQVGTPDDVAELLLHAQIHLGGVAQARKRLLRMPNTSS